MVNPWGSSCPTWSPSSVRWGPSPRRWPRWLPPSPLSLTSRPSGRIHSTRWFGASHQTEVKIYSSFSVENSLHSKLIPKGWERQNSQSFSVGTDPLGSILEDSDHVDLKTRLFFNKLGIRLDHCTFYFRRFRSCRFKNKTFYNKLGIRLDHCSFCFRGFQSRRFKNKTFLTQIRGV